MAFKKSKTSISGQTGEYWYAIPILNRLTKTGNIQMVCFINEDGKKVNKFSSIKGFEKNFSVNPDKYDEYFGSDVISPADVNLEMQAYKYVKEYTTTSIDNDGTKVIESSWFTDAIELR